MEGVCQRWSRPEAFSLEESGSSSTTSRAGPVLQHGNASTVVHHAYVAPRPPANQGSLDTNTVNLFRQMMQAQDEQIRAQASQVQQLTVLVKNLALAGAQNAAQVASGSGPATAEQAAAASSGDPSGPTPMDVDAGIRSRRAENYIPSLPQLNFASMTTRHAEIRVWSSYRDELTSWLCLVG